MEYMKWLYRHSAKLVAVAALVIGVIGAIISVSDALDSQRARHDQAEPWVSIRTGLKDLETFDVNIQDKSISQLHKDEPGYGQLMRIIQRNMDLTVHGTPVALWAQPRGLKETIAGRFTRQSVYFGIVNQDDVRSLLEDMILLKSWVREYRHQYYVLKGLRLILISFVLQLVATLLPANKELKATDKSAP